MARKRKPTTDALEILHRRYVEGRPQRLAQLKAERANVQIARLSARRRKKTTATAPRTVREE